MLSCTLVSETLHHFIYECHCAKLFWEDFETFQKSLTDHRINFCSKDIVISILSKDLFKVAYYSFMRVQEVYTINVQI